MADHLLPTLAHELRQPLNALLMALSTVNHADRDISIAQEAHEIAKHQAHHMSRIIDDMLDAFRHAKGNVRLNLASVDLKAIVYNAIETARPAIASRGHRLSVSLPDEQLVLEADPSQLERILTNLLTNAAKYTDPGGRIFLAAELSYDRVVIRICDNGRGITPDLLPRIFDLYQRGPNQRESGLGLGLALVKALVELHGGSVSAQSQGIGKGSEFIVLLPLSHTVSAAMNTNSATPLVA